MTTRKKDNFSAEDLLNNLFKPVAAPQKESLKEIFDRRANELGIAVTSICDYLKIEMRTLNGIISGTQKRTDYTNLVKIANFLQMPIENVIQLYIEILEKNNPIQGDSAPDTIRFIQENFDLVALRNSGFIKNTTDYAGIEKTITNYFGLTEISDYSLPSMDVAFSEGFIKPKNLLTRGFWINAAKNSFETINNPYDYDREGLIKYFPQIRWHSTSVELGLINIIKYLYKLGITVIYQEPFSSLHLRGATFPANNKPCIVITDYKGFYPTLWFALVHELFHVLFDWEEIKNNKYHLSGKEDNDLLSVKVREDEANSFARKYLLSREKTESIKRYINDDEYVVEFAKNNDVHSSFIYVFNARDSVKSSKLWALAQEHNPPTQPLIDPIRNKWDNHKPIKEFVKSIKYKLYS